MSYCITLQDSCFSVPAEHAKAVATELRKRLYEAFFDDNGNIDAIGFNGSNLSDEECLWEQIAPMIEDGSFLEYRGEGGDIWRWVFHGGKCYELTATIIWPELPAEKED
ncbi:MAG: hypothetical protein LBS84_03180 [Clostridiales bacterium]|jgi:hypothetical protein|nr:hypothetical protein [Clostridiales bacterium]